MASIEVLMNGQKELTRSFEGERLLIGREPICNLQLNHPSVSRQHCAIARKGEVFVLEDLRSSNGTFVNGRKVSGAFYLNNGDDIQVGEFTLKFQFESQAGQVAPEFEPTMLVQNKEAQEALRKGIPPPEIAAGLAAPAPAKASSPAIEPALPVAPSAQPPSAAIPVAPAPTAPPPPAPSLPPPVEAKPAVPVPVAGPAVAPPPIEPPAPPPLAPSLPPPVEAKSAVPVPVAGPAVAPPPIEPPAPRSEAAVVPPVRVAPASPPKPAPVSMPRQDLLAPGKYDDPFDVPTLRPPPIEIEPPKPAARPLPPPLPKAPAPPAPPPLPAGRPPSSPGLPPPLPAVRPAASAGMPVAPPPIPVSGRVPVVPPPLPPQVAPPPIPAAPPPLSPNDPRVALTMLPPAPPVPPPPPPPLAPNDPRSALAIPPPSSPAMPPPVRMPAGTPVPVHQTPRSMAPVGGVVSGPVEYAGFFARFAALLIDSFILMVPMFLVMLPISILVGRTSPLIAITVSIVMNLATVAVICFYFAKLESGPQMATFGKRVMGLQVTDLNGQQISFMRGVGRYFARIPSSFFAIGYIMAAFTEKKQALHDILAGCLVIRRKP